MCCLPFRIQNPKMLIKCSLHNRFNLRNFLFVQNHCCRSVWCPVNRAALRLSASGSCSGLTADCVALASCVSFPEKFLMCHCGDKMLPVNCGYSFSLKYNLSREKGNLLCWVNPLHRDAKIFHVVLLNTLLNLK